MEFVMMKSAYQVTPFFGQDHPSHKKGWVLSLTLNPISYLSACCSSPPLYVSLIVCELLINTEPSIIALVYRSPNIPPPDNISLIFTIVTIVSHRSDCVVLGHFNCPKVNWVSNAAPP